MADSYASAPGHRRRNHLRCIDDLHAMLKQTGDWLPLGVADEQKEAKADTVEAWGRSSSNPVQGWYGFKALGLAEVEHNPRNNRMRAIGR